MLKNALFICFLCFSVLAFAFDAGVKVEVDSTKFFAFEVKTDAAYREVLQLCRTAAIAKGMPEGTTFTDYVRKQFLLSGKDFDQAKAEFVFGATAGASYIVSEETKNKIPIYPKKTPGYRYKVEYLARVASPQFIADSPLAPLVSVSKASLKPGEQAELSITPMQDGYLYAFLVSANDKMRMILPPPKADNKLSKKGVAVKQSFVAEANMEATEGIATLYVIYAPKRIEGWYKFHPKEDYDGIIEIGDSSFNMMKTWLPQYDPNTRADRFIQLKISQ